MQSLCRDQRRLLREVSRSSRLPDGLGDLSHKPAIKIHFDEAADSEAAARLARRVDAWAVELDKDPKRARSTIASSSPDSSAGRAEGG